MTLGGGMGGDGADGCGRLTCSFAQDLLEGRHRGRGLPWDYHEVKSWEPQLHGGREKRETNMTTV